MSELDRALFEACALNNYNAACDALDRGANVNGFYGNAPPLVVACISRALGIVRLLLDRGANVNISEINGITPLHAACQRADVDSARLLLDRGAGVNTSTFRGRASTPLATACAKDTVPLVRLLLDRGGRLDATTAGGWTLLHWACKHRAWNVARFLFERGVAIDTKNHYGETPLDLIKGAAERAAFMAHLTRPFQVNIAHALAAATAAGHLPDTVLLPELVESVVFF